MAKIWLATIDLKPGENVALALPTTDIEAAADALLEASFQAEEARKISETITPAPKPVVRDWLFCDGLEEPK